MAQASTAWTASPAQWHERIADAVDLARNLRTEQSLDELEYHAVLNASLEAMRAHAIVVEQTAQIARLPPGVSPR
jgi:hypothetical protein